MNRSYEKAAQGRLSDPRLFEAVNPMDDNCTAAREQSLLERAVELQGIVERIESRSNQIRTILFGAEPEGKNPSTSPTSLDGFIYETAATAREVEYLLDRIQRRLVGE